MPDKYDVRDTNMALIGSDLDHKVKYNSALKEPAWTDGVVGQSAGLFVWRIEKFEVVPWPKENHGWFYDGDSYIVLSSAGPSPDKLVHNIFFWLGRDTTQDEAGTAAYKTVELDEFLGGRATQHREVQEGMSGQFLALFPNLGVRHGGVESGFRAVSGEKPPGRQPALLRVFQARNRAVVAWEVAPKADQLKDDDVFILVSGTDRVFVWQGSGCSPMERAKASQMVHEIITEDHASVTVLSQGDSDEPAFNECLGEVATALGHRTFPEGACPELPASQGERRLLRVSDASGELSFTPCAGPVSRESLDEADVFVLEVPGEKLWVWMGSGASKGEKAAWFDIARAYVKSLSGSDLLLPVAAVKSGSECAGFLQALA
ncbi:Severin [Diplonema papillatum]|nr:Severin [Diplonema papillatum]|eukprot:gene16410-25158_t